MSRALGFWIALLLVFSGSILIYTTAKKMKANQSPGGSREQVGDGSLAEPKMEEFELIDQTGPRFSSNELKGKVWLGSFFFVSCPATCYQQNQKLQQLYVKYADQGLEIVSISCDPDNDTPVALAGYANRFNASSDNWKFLTTLDGDRKYLQKIGNDFLGISVDAHQVTHSDRVVVLDRDGKIRGSYRVLIPTDFKQLEETLAEIYSSESTVAEEATNESDSKNADAEGDTNVSEDDQETATTAAAASPTP